MLRLSLMLFLSWTVAAQADGLVAARTLPAGSVLTSSDLIISETAGGISSPSDVIGMQTRVTIYEGRPVLPGNLRRPRLVERNQMVRLSFQRGALRIETEARALDEGTAGDTIRVMNIASRSTVSATVNTDGSLTIAP